MRLLKLPKNVFCLEALDPATDDAASADRDDEIHGLAGRIDGEESFLSHWGVSIEEMEKSDRPLDELLQCPSIWYMSRWAVCAHYFRAVM